MQIKAQYHYEHRYGIDNGLLSVEVEQVYSSRKGEIWVSYSVLSFLSKFDGVSWTHYDLLKLKLPQKILVMEESNQGIWFMSPTDQLEFVLYDKSENWRQFTFDRSFKYAFDPQTKLPVLFGPDFIPFYYNVSIQGFEKQKSPLFTPDINDDFERFFLISTNAGLHIQYSESNNQYIRVHYGDDFKNIRRFKCDFYVEILEEGDTLRLLTIQNGITGILNNNKFEPFIFQSPNASPVRILKSIHRIYSRSPLSSEKKYYFLCETSADNQSHIYESDMYGNSKLIIKNAPLDLGRVMAIDHFGRFWFTTSSGISRIDTSQVSLQDNNPNMVRGLHTLAEDTINNIWLGGYAGSFPFSTFDGKQLNKFEFKNFKSFIPILPGTFRDKSGHLYYFGESNIGLFGISEEKIIPIKARNPNEKLFGYIFQPLANGLVALGLAAEGLAIARLENFKIDTIRIIGKDKGLQLINILAIVQDKKERIWMGRTSQGIAVYDPVKDTVFNWMREDHPDNGLGVLCLSIDEKNTLWMGTQKGLFYIENIDQFNVKENLFDCAKEICLPGDPQSTPTFLLNDEKYFIVGTSVAVHFIDKSYKAERPRIFSMRFRKDLEGSGSEQNAVLKDSKGYLWVGAQTGAIRFDLNKMPFDTSATELSLDYFRAGGVDIPYSNNKISDIPAKIRNLEIAFRASGNPMLHNNLVFDIILLRSGGDTLYSKINTTELNFDLEYLPSDDYMLQVIAYKNNVESARVNYAFVIPSILTERPMFWASLALLIMAIPGLWFITRLRHKKSLLQQEIRLEQSKRERDELKILALANFFNPHFINNSLHWIQSKYRKDPDTAQIIQRLAENVNILFHNSNKGKAYHALGNEIELVKNYLGIQQIRFDRDFQISIEVPEASERWKNVNIPSMLLQIHTENAIEKGIRQRRAANCFKLTISEYPNHLDIYLEDDGIGRNNREQDKVILARKGSTTIMLDLIEVLNKYNSEKILIQYRDNIFSDEYRAYGTGIKIILPKNYKYDIL